MKKPSLLSISILLALFFGCASCGVRSRSPEAFLHRHGISPAVTDSLTVCTGFGCSLLGQARLSGAVLSGLDDAFGKAPSTAERERQAVGRAIAYLERVVGGQVGTGGDCPRNKRNKAARGQLDCIAEAANTTSYLLLLQRRGMLSFHEVAAPEHRGATVFTAHNTAVLRERGGGEYAVDSWFHANGHLPEIVNLSRWKQGFQPVDKAGRDAGLGAGAQMETDDGV